MRLVGKVAIVTGGLSGIGQAVARRFAAEGARVVAADLGAPAGPLGDGAVAPHHLDVSQEGSCAALTAAVLARHGRLDILVNSAGIGRDIPFLDTPVAEFDKLLAVNLRGTFLIGQAAARAMIPGGGGVIVNLASISGERGNMGRAGYGASKGGVITLTKVMAVELAEYGIRANAISPGPVETPLVAAMHTQGIREGMMLGMPIQKYSMPDDVAAAALFLCSDEASTVTGHVLAVDGGFLGAGVTRGMTGR